jgi:hypothetical protein
MDARAACDLQPEIIAPPVQSTVDKHRHMPTNMPLIVQYVMGKAGCCSQRRVQNVAQAARRNTLGWAGHMTLQRGCKFHVNHAVNLRFPALPA